VPISIGSRLGPYEILAPLGAGGMGEVYKARDSRLGRTVALKVLPERLSADGELRQRFEREARTISQLSHPHICALYDVGHQHGTDFLVMEYLEGQTLSERLVRGPLPLEHVLRHGIEIANALDKAHRGGIVHRDLKPGNVMLTASGVKLLDFGLARVLAPSGGDSILTALPTETPLTEKGAILGTVQYMAPEQLEGKDSDARTDVFALGAILYEMATGKKAFVGASHASLIGSILRDQPPSISQLQPIAPRALDRIVATCLAKDPEDRWQTARDVSLQLKGIAEEQSTPGTMGTVRPSRRRTSALLPWLIAAAAAVVGLYALTSRPRESERPRVLRSSLLPPPNTTFHIFGANVAAPVLSPDGRRLAFGTLEAEGFYRLWVRDLEDLDAYPVPGGDGALFPFWSPDSRSIGFFAKGKLKVVDASPSPPPPRDLADVVEARGGTWGADGTIVYAAGNFTPLMRVSAAGGKPAQATRLDRAAGELANRWPRFLPDGRRFLYEVRKASADPSAPAMPVGTYVGSLDGREKRLILSEGTSVTYSPPGYLLFRRANTLMAVACDPKSLELRGDPVVLTDSLEGFSATGLSLFSVLEDLLIYSPQMGLNPSRLVWLDGTGKELSTVGPPGRFTHLTLSPDGRAVVVAQIEEPLPPDLWIFDAGVGRGIRLTRDAVAQIEPVFSPDGRVFYSSFSTGPWDLWEMRPQGVKSAKPFLESASTKTACDVSPDGRWLLYREFNTGTRGDLKAVPLIGDRQPRAFVATGGDEGNGDFSPDSRWVAYASDESGRKEVYAASFPDPTRRFRVSSDGGAQPRWSRDGKELFYVRSGRLVAAAVGRQGEDLTFGESRSLFPFPLFTLVDPGFDLVTRYDVAPDGRFLALLRSGDESPTPLVLVQNWREALKTPPK
jgi:serine/threonine protein kinase/Tol biopolymer transport system component